MVLTPGALRPSNGSAVIPTAVAANSCRAALTGSVTWDCTWGWGATASGRSPPATRTSPLPSPTADVAIGINIEHQPPHVGVITGGGHHRHRAAIRQGGGDGIGAVGFCVARYQQGCLICQQGVAAAGHYRIHIREIPGQLDLMVERLQMGGHDDDVDALAGQAVYLGLHHLGDHGVDRHVTQTGDEGQLRSGGADNSDAASLLGHHHRRGDQAPVDQSLQGRFCGHVKIGAYERSVSDLFDKPGDQVGTQIELVVADCESVVADQVQSRGVIERTVLDKAGRQLRAAQDVVSRGES